MFVVKAGMTIPAARFTTAVPSPRFSGWGSGDPLVSVQRDGRVYQMPLSEAQRLSGGGSGNDNNNGSDWWEHIKALGRKLAGRD